MIEPDLDQLRQQMKLPSSALFYGWLIHNPKCGDFLHSFKQGQLTTETFWAATPESGFEFTQFEHAVETFQLLQLQRKAVIVAAFDVDQKIVISSPQQDHESNNDAVISHTLSNRILH
ncbi:hypothetical protein VII00023_02029 [Vibrio ichthyoenteri ATCC 700023]|uniref:Uncharacterized protein n=1 Tax=Vibrio ichthyoenteri ATCC 700023 TaxID=870968 RepID=F9RY15_9VIBR|nr:hypothetical protein [Vibrio ichthyoenteri]EGU47015.1 hypothetical protein VII00023_02029 [Vibrio ichthyoenteri ATCC 700023]